MAGRPDVQKYIIDSLGFEYDSTEIFEKGLRHYNNIIPDFRITKGEQILAIVECKGPGINVTDYVRGIGQLLQYEYFYDKKYSPKVQLYILKNLKLYIFSLQM